MRFSKSSQAGRYGRRKLKRIDTPENYLQSFVDDYIETRRIECMRIPDSFWRHISAALRKNWNWLLIAVRKMLGGYPDNTLYIPVSDRYSLCLMLELKTKTGLHGKQIEKSRDNPWQIAQTPEEAQNIIDRFIRDAADLSERMRTNDSMDNQENAHKRKVDKRADKHRTQICKGGMEDSES